jgi:hypothetical protein
MKGATMAAIKDISKIAEKFKRVTPQRTQDYQEGVSAPRRSWSSAASAATETHKQATMDALNRGAYAKGVQRAGDSAWSNGALTKGVNRFGEGVTLGADKYATNFAPYASVIGSTQLPPRYPRGDARNYARGKAIGDALNKKRISTT